MKQFKKPTLFVALMPIVIMILCFIIGIGFFGADPHVPMLTASIITGVIAMVVLDYDWTTIQEGIAETVSSAIPAALILLVVGMLISSWTASGVVPTMIYYGIKIISPKFFLTSTVIICSIVSSAIGSSWTTAATVGIALMGIGVSMGIPKEIIAGAIISGSYFGDKMSPLSDTTNLASAVTGVDLYEHIKHMLYTVTPSYIISLILFQIINSRFVLEAASMENIAMLSEGIASNFNISPYLFIIPVVLLVLVLLKVNAITSLFSSAILAAVVAVLYQKVPVGEIVDIMHYGFSIDSGNEVIDELLSSGGLDGMMWTVGLIITAMTFAGILRRTGMIDVITANMLKYTRTVGSLVLTTVLSSMGLNYLTGEQYLAIAIPGGMYKDLFKKQNLHPKNLSRILEDAGTITSPLVPWNGCGAFMVATLGLTSWTYVFYCFLNIITPIVSIIYGYTGITMEPLDSSKKIGYEDSLKVPHVEV